MIVSPIRRTRIAAGTREFFTWWLLLNLQVVFCRFSFLEELLRMVPGLYSAWLRLWGSRIGRLTYWAAGTAVLERQFLERQGTVSLAATMRAMAKLTEMYHNLLQDYPRAAFWLQQIARRHYLRPGQVVELANCYWSMGCRTMAVDTVSNMRTDYVGGRLIQLWADMGDLQRALAIAEATANTGGADRAFIAAGNACRQYGFYREALGYYRRALAISQRYKDRDLNVKRARANIEAVVLFETLDVARVPDGVYEDQSMGFNGTIRVSVTVAAGRVESVEILQHNEKQFFNAFNEMTAQVVANQGVRGIDATTGATITASAVMNAAAKALSKGMQ